MHSIRRTHLGLLCVLALPLALWGCGSGFTEEMRQQESEMTNESADWNSKLPQWLKDVSDQSAWHASHPVPAADAEKVESLRKHVERMSNHGEALARFRQSLDEHLAKLQEERAKPEKGRVAAHAGLWAEHLKLKAEFGLLSSAHEDLAKEHGEMVAASQGAGS